MAKKEEIFHSYVIPFNFIDESKALGGMVKTRNLVEGGILAAFFSLPLFFIKIKNLTLFVFIASILILPPLVFGIIGINGDPLSTFLMYAMQYRKKKRLVSFNSKVKFHERSDLENLDENELPRDKILKIVNNLVQKRESMGENEDLIDEEYVFDDDIEEIKKREEEMRKAMKSKQIEEEEEEYILGEEILESYLEENIIYADGFDFEIEAGDDFEVISGIEIIDDKNNLCEDSEIIVVPDFEKAQMDASLLKKRKQLEEEKEKELQRKVAEEMAFLEVQRKKEEARKGIWTCPVCNKTNISKFCDECGTKKPE